MPTDRVKHRAGISTDYWTRFRLLLESEVTTPPGAVTFTAPADGSIPAWRAVTYSDGDSVILADPLLDLEGSPQVILGISIVAAADGATLTVVRTGVYTNPAWTWDPDAGPVVLGYNGILQQGAPPGAEVLQPLGLALGATRMIVRLDPASVIT